MIRVFWGLLVFIFQASDQIVNLQLGYLTAVDFDLATGLLFIQPSLVVHIQLAPEVFSCRNRTAGSLIVL